MTKQEIENAFNIAFCESFDAIKNLYKDKSVDEIGEMARRVAINRVAMEESLNMEAKDMLENGYVIEHGCLMRLDKKSADELRETERAKFTGK